MVCFSNFIVCYYPVLPSYFWQQAKYRGLWKMGACLHRCILSTPILKRKFKHCDIPNVADDNGEGGTFAVYSLLSRYMNITWRDPKAASLKLQRYDTEQLGKANKG